MAKRGHNEGSIYQRESDGKWVGSVNLGYGLDGKRKRKVVYGTTRREVAEKLKGLLRDQQQGLPIVIERETVGQFLKRWLEDSAKPAVRPKTFVSYRQICELHIIPALGRVQLTQLSAPQVQALLNKKLSDGLSPRTVLYIRAVLRRALNQAMRWQLVPRNVATLVDAPRAERHEIRPFTPAQAKTFIQAIRGHRLEALFVLAITTGMRQGEMLGLRWEDVSFDDPSISVRYTLQRVGGPLRLVEPKTIRSKRTLPLSKTIAAVLRAHRARQREERLLAGQSWQDTGMVFCSTIGTYLEPSGVLKAFKKVLDKAGLPKQRFHDLRHAAVSLMLAQNVPASTARRK